MNARPNSNPLGLDDDEPGDRELNHVTELDATEAEPSDREAARREAEAQAAIDAAAAEIETHGIDLENFISMRSLVDLEWLAANVTSKPKGTIEPIGMIVGIVREYSREPSTLPLRPGETPLPESIKLKGTFEAQSYVTGEIVTAANCYLPAVMAVEIEKAILGGALNVQLNMEVSAIATGRAIPYRYKVRSFFATEEQKALAAIRRGNLKRLEAQGRASIVARLTAPKA